MRPVAHFAEVQCVTLALSRVISMSGDIKYFLPGDALLTWYWKFNCFQTGDAPWLGKGRGSPDIGNLMSGDIQNFQCPPLTLHSVLGDITVWGANSGDCSMRSACWLRLPFCPDSHPMDWTCFQCVEDRAEIQFQLSGDKHFSHRLNKRDRSSFNLEFWWPVRLICSWRVGSKETKDTCHNIITGLNCAISPSPWNFPSWVEPG